MTVFFQQLQSAVARVVEANLPDRFWIVEYRAQWDTKLGSGVIEKILAIGDRQVCQREFEKAVKASSCCKLSRGARTKGYADGSESGEDFETFRVKETSRKQFLGVVFNPALSDMLKVAADETAAKE